jgi:hypothetical protein
MASHTPEPTDEPTNEPTAVPTDTPTPTEIPTGEPVVETAVIIQPASIFAEPTADSTEKAIQRVGDRVQILGKSPFGNWYYVQNDAFVTGFVYAELVEWDGDLDTLSIYNGDGTITQPSTPNENITALEFDLFHLEETGRCTSDNWFMILFFEGRGGNGVYDYYWDDELVAAKQSSSFSLEISSAGGSIIANGQVTSGDGQTMNQELFIPTPSCFGG